ARLISFEDDAVECKGKRATRQGGCANPAARPLPPVLRGQGVPKGARPPLIVSPSTVRPITTLVATTLRTERLTAACNSVVIVSGSWTLKSFAQPPERVSVVAVLTATFSR